MIPASARNRKKSQPALGVSRKCAVSGCPNSTGSLNRSALNRPPKRFFKFPTNPDQLKVWLAALRETNRDPSEQLFICEDHFLPEDIFKNGISSDAIPIMPPYVDGAQQLISPWSCDSLEEEEEQWPTRHWDTEEEEEEKEEAPPPPSAAALQQNPDRGSDNPSAPELKRDFCSENEATSWFIREGTSVARLTRGFLELLMAAPDHAVDVREVAVKLQTHVHRVHTVIDVLLGMDLVQTESDQMDDQTLVRWIGSSPIYSFLWRDTLQFLTMLQRLTAMEDEVDQLFKTCAWQLFALTEDEENAALAYISCQDVCRLGGLQQQTAILIRSPPETKLTIPPPDEDGIQMNLVSEKGPIVALTCEVGPLNAEPSRVFSALESRVRMKEVGGKKLQI
ncbi:PREDICTED: transcription factor E2F1-like [Cyprinodon variegatus]|uniref:transcription factor E2F1-like n=1 Tax=Cyprinodon variegatus TaxID=28743 RepID=UPI000742870B|nr:PREDICTED: transcription factor E2F1-like [Cyprinodon variegatus]